MAATTVEKNIGESLVLMTVSAPSYRVKAGAKLLAGTIGCLDATGYAVPAATATGLTALGVAQKTVDNTSGASGALESEIKPGVFKLLNSSAGDLIAVTELGKVCYIVDNQTVAKTDGTGTRSVAGTVVRVDTDGVLVAIGYNVLVPVVSGANSTSVQSGTATLVAGVTAAIPANITATSRIFGFLNTPANGSLTVKFAALGADRVVGAPGSFKLTALLAAGTINTADTSTMDWFAIG